MEITMETLAYKKCLSSIRDAVRVPIFVQRDITFFYTFINIHRHRHRHMHPPAHTHQSAIGRVYTLDRICIGSNADRGLTSS